MRRTDVKQIAGSSGPPRYVMPRTFDDHHASANPFTCGCYHCHSEFWCKECLRNRELVLAGKMKFENAGLWGTEKDPQPAFIRLKGGFPISHLCKFHKPVDNPAGERPLTMLEALAKKAGIEGPQLVKGMP